MRVFFFFFFFLVRAKSNESIRIQFSFYISQEIDHSMKNEQPKMAEGSFVTLVTQNCTKAASRRFFLATGGG